MSKEKSLIDLARETMEAAGIDPSKGVDLESLSPQNTNETPAAAPTPAPVEAKPQAQETTDVVEGRYEDVLNDLLSEVKVVSDWIKLTLPSRGKAYVSCDEEIEIKPFTFLQEKKLRSIRNVNASQDIIKTLFKDCVRGLDYDSMTLADKNYILFKLREMSYGDDYSIEAVCTNCEAKNKLVVKISQVPIKFAEDSFEEPITITLPDSKQEVVFVTPRNKDEKYLSDMEKVTDNLWRFALSVGKYTDERIKKAFFEKTTVKDVVFFREHLLKDYYGMEDKMSFVCASCEEEVEGQIPFNENFFSVS